MKFSKTFLVEQKRSLTFYKYFFSYIACTLLLLVIVGSVVYSSFITSLQREVETSNIASLSQIRNTMDARLREMERMTLQISSNPRLTPSVANANGYDSFSAVRELKNYNSTSTFVYDIVLYYKNSSKILASSGCYTFNDFFNREYVFENMKKEDFLDNIVDINTPVMRSIENVAIQRLNPTSFATYIHPMPVNLSSPYGYALYLIQEKTLCALVDNVLKNYNGFVYILDENGSAVISIANGKPDNEKNQMLGRIGLDTLKKTVSVVNVEGERYSVVRLVSDYNNWSYTTVIPTAQFMQSAYKSRKIFNALVVAVFLLGLIMAFVFATHNYKPLKGLVRLLQGQFQDKSSQPCSDEIVFITNTIDRIANENHNMMTKLKSKSGMLKEQVLMDLLKGKMDKYNEIGQFPEFCGLEFNRPWFSVILFIIDDYKRFTSENKKSFQDLLKFSIINVFEELSAEIGNGYGLDLLDDRGIAFIVNFGASTDANMQLCELARKCKEFFKQNFGFTLTAGIGGNYNSILKVHQSYMEANRAALYRLIKGYDNIICYDGLGDIDARKKSRYPLHTEEKLLSAIKQGKGSVIEDILKEFNKYIVKQQASFDTVQFFCFSIIHSVIKALEELNMQDFSHLDKEVEELFALKFETLDELSTKMTALVKKICVYVERQKESKNFGLREKINSYIEKHYNDKNLSLEIIAQKFELSPSYITRYYKDQTGYPIMRYVDMLRMDRAKRLLKDTEMTLRGILDDIGCVDETNFIRKFKKYEKMTPMQYRKMGMLSMESEFEESDL